MSVVTWIAGPHVRVECAVRDGGIYDVLGHADWNRRVIELAPAVCGRLNGLASTPAPPSTTVSYAQAQALLVLVHESVHLSGYPGRKNEALTECRAIQLVHDAALVLGVQDETAAALGHEALYYDAKLPGPGDWRVGLHELPDYHAAGCYDGGPLDIHPDSHDWPN
jgi:hypothetical protein